MKRSKVTTYRRCARPVPCVHTRKTTRTGAFLSAFLFHRWNFLPSKTTIHTRRVRPRRKRRKTKSLARTLRRIAAASAGCGVQCMHNDSRATASLPAPLGLQPEQATTPPIRLASIPCRNTVSGELTQKNPIPVELVAVQQRRNRTKTRRAPRTTGHRRRSDSAARRSKNLRTPFWNLASRDKWSCSHVYTLGISCTVGCRKVVFCLPCINSWRTRVCVKRCL